MLGTEDGLYAVELTRDSVMRVGDRKAVYHVEVLTEEQLFVTLAGRQRHVRLTPLAALEKSSVESIKLEETRGCSALCVGSVRQGTSVCLCAAIKRAVIVFEINRTRQRHRRLKEIACPGPVQSLQMAGERLFVGFPSSFAIHSVQGDGMPIGQCPTHYIYVF